MATATQPAPESESESLLTYKEVAEWLSVRPKRVYELSIPRVQLSNQTYRWRRRDVREFIESRLTDW